MLNLRIFFTVCVALPLVILPGAARAFDVTLRVLNPPNQIGEVVVVANDLIEVEFSVADPLAEDVTRRLMRSRRVTMSSGWFGWIPARWSTGNSAASSSSARYR